MTTDEFWQLIGITAEDDNLEERLERIEHQLAVRSAKEIVSFERQLQDRMSESYTWELWGAAYLINGGCSDDGFDYFRGWLILQGRTVFEQALANPDSLADYPGLEEDVECEEILYVAGVAHEEKAGCEIPDVPLNLPELGEGWDFDDDDEMRTRYPKLYARFCAD